MHSLYADNPSISRIHSASAGASCQAIEKYRKKNSQHLTICWELLDHFYKISFIFTGDSGCYALAGDGSSSISRRRTTSSSR
jgi:hypothetical protein